ncbi:hypothetical protein FGB62_71g210 [Gracilaria domingensis]|nr:hypothetical protein FGB62_71g210 [Gracilaria domingensis]
MSKPGPQIARIIAEPPPTRLVPAAEAARQAAAAHVWRSAYEQGARAGWAAGWAAATEQNEVSSAEGPKFQLELSQECARLFSRPKSRRQNTPEEEPIKHDLSSMGGGTAERARLQHKRRLYGENAERIIESENAAEAHFRAEASRSGAHYWPVVPLRNSQ